MLNSISRRTFFGVAGWLDDRLKREGRRETVPVVRVTLTTVCRIEAEDVGVSTEDANSAGRGTSGAGRGL